MHKNRLFGFMNNFSPQGFLAGLSEMAELHEEVKLLLAVVHKQAQELQFVHLSQFQLLVFVLVVETG